MPRRRYVYVCSAITTFKIRLQQTIDLPYEEAVEKARGALKDEGFGVLCEIDLKEKLKEKLGVDFRKYVILGACNPPLAYKTLQQEIDIGLLLPCNVIVYEADETGKSVVGENRQRNTQINPVIEHKHLLAASEMVQTDTAHPSGEQETYPERAGKDPPHQGTLLRKLPQRFAGNSQ